jgi:hypothetical protein
LAASILPIRIDDLHLDAKHQKFVYEYTSNGCMDVLAGIASGLISEDSSLMMQRARVHKIMVDPNVVTAIERVNDSFAAPYRNRFINQTIARLELAANYDISWYYYDDGTKRPLDEIDPRYRVLIENIDPKVFGKNADVDKSRYILPDKTQARKELMELLKKKEKATDTTSDSGIDLQALFSAVRLGAQLTEPKKSDVPMIPAPEQQTTIAQSPSEIFRKLKNGQS